MGMGLTSIGCCNCPASAVVFKLVNPCTGNGFVGVSVSLYTPTGMTLIGTSTTDSNGCVNFGTFSTASGTAYPFSASGLPNASRYVIASTVGSVGVTATCSSGAFTASINVATGYVCDPGHCGYPIPKTLYGHYTSGYGTKTLVYTPFAGQGYQNTWVDSSGNYYLYNDSVNWYDNFFPNGVAGVATCNPFQVVINATGFGTLNATFGET